MVLAGTIFPLRNAVHAPLSIAAFTLAVVAVFLIGLGLRQDTRWRAFASYSFVAGVICVGLLLLTIATGQGVLAAWVGLLQRLSQPEYRRGGLNRARAGCARPPRRRHQIVPL